MQGTGSVTPQTTASGNTALVSPDWAVAQLKAQWPALVVEEVLPQQHSAKVHLRASFPEVGFVGVRVLAQDPKDPHGTARLTAAYHRAQKVSGIKNPGAVKILQVGSLSGCLVIVTEWQAGESLLEHRKRVPPVGESALDLIDAMATAMETYHAAGWVHGHLRSDSFFVTEKGEEVRLCGMGILDTLTGEVPGPLDVDRIYMASELNGREAEERQMVGDVYSLGVVAYELITGEKPAGHFMKMPSQVTGSGKWLDDVILRAIHPDPQLRIASVSEFRGAMMARELRVMEIPDKLAEERERKKKAAEKRPVEESGVTAAVRVQFALVMLFSMAVIGGAIYFGIDRYKNQKDTQASMEDAVMALAQVMNAMSDGTEEMDLKAMMDKVADADPAVQLEALQEQLANLEAEGKREEALKLAKMVAEANLGKEGPSVEAIQQIFEELQKEMDLVQDLMAKADAALLAGDLDAELAGLMEVLEIDPNHPLALRRLSQTPSHFAKAWEMVERELKEWNPEQKEWHATTYRQASGLEVDLSGHENLVYLRPLQKLPIDRLDIRHTNVEDLAPLAGMSLTAFWCDDTEVSHLEVLGDQPIEILGLTQTRMKNYQTLERLPFIRVLRVDAGVQGVTSRIPYPKGSREWENALGIRFLPLQDDKALFATRELTAAEFGNYEASLPRGARLGDGVEGDGEEEKRMSREAAEMSFVDALNFCEWLTAVDRSHGYLQPGAIYRLPEPQERQELQDYVKVSLLASGKEEKGEANAVAETAASKGGTRQVTEGPCQRGFFDVLDNVDEWAVSYRDLQLFNVQRKVGRRPAGKRGVAGLRLVVDLTNAQDRKASPGWPRQEPVGPGIMASTPEEAE